MVQHAYIPERFIHTFRGFPKKYPYEAIKLAQKKEDRKIQLKKRLCYKHKSRGNSWFKKQLEGAIMQGKDTDWYYNGDDEYPVSIFNQSEATNCVFRLLKERGLIKHLMYGD